MASSYTQLIIPTFILLAGVIDDLRFRKVHNWLVMACGIFAVASVLILIGPKALWLSLGSAALAVALTLPLVLAKALGAGDMKLLIAFSLATTTPTAIFYVVIYSVIWGALLGLFRAVLQGEGLNLIKQTAQLTIKKNSAPEKLHHIPYTVALFFGWLTYLSFQGVHPW